MSQSVAADDQRIAIVAGLRTPFARQLTTYRDTDAIALGALVTSELLSRLSLDPTLIDRVVYGQVGIMPSAPNIAREVVLGSGMKPSTDAYSVSRACATGFQTVADIARAIAAGDIEIGLAGGADSTSVLPIQAGPKLARALIHASKAKTLTKKINLFRKLRPADLVPRPPAIRDYSTGLGMGDIAEQMAKSHQIDREQQDRLALRSHQRAAQAWQDGKLDQEVMPIIPPPHRQYLHYDNNIRTDANLDKLAALRPAFDRRHGTVTAGNATPLTDGAASVLMMTALRARQLGLDPLGTLRSMAFVALDPFHDGLMGPSYAVPIALDRAGVTLNDLTLIDMHEAFASQTLANLKAWTSHSFARDRLNRDRPIGEVDWDKFNVLGGSLAYGHPFAATGTRMIIQTFNELRRRGGGLGLVTACAAGGLGAAMVLEVA